MPAPKYSTADEVLAVARSLAALPAGAVESRLEMLRLRYRKAPSLFTPETLQLLRQAGERANQARAGAHDDRALRKALADERKVPALVVFSDRALQDMAARKPRTRDEFLDVHGVGQKKLEEYGDSFIAEILREG